MILNTDEKIIVANSFGTVTNQRVQFNLITGIKELPVKQVYSASFNKKNNRILIIIYILSAFGILGSLFLLENYIELIKNNFVAILLLTSFSVIAMFQFIGYHLIKINEVGDERIIIKVNFSKTKEGREFVDALNDQLLAVTY